MDLTHRLSMLSKPSLEYVFEVVAARFKLGFKHDTPRGQFSPLGKPRSGSCHFPVIEPLLERLSLVALDPVIHVPVARFVFHVCASLGGSHTFVPHLVELL